MKISFITFITCAVLLGACSHQTGNNSQDNQIPNNESETFMTTELIINDVLVGEGDEAKSGDEVSVHYTGTLTDGTKFDSSVDRGVPFTFNLGAGQVIAGWDQGVVGMKVGGKRQLTIPSDLAYGNRANGSIPANSTLLFEIELLGVNQ